MTASVAKSRPDATLDPVAFTKTMQARIPGSDGFEALSDGTEAKAFVFHWRGSDGETTMVTAALVALKEGRIYRSPRDQRFRFIPCGADTAFSKSHGEVRGALPKSTYGAGELAARLWSIPELRARYEARLKQLLDELWDEQKLGSEVDRIGELTGASAIQLGVVRHFINGRQAELESELRGRVPRWPTPPRDTATECRATQAASGRFDVEWSETHRYSPEGTFELDLVIDGSPLRLDTERLSAAGPVPELDEPAYGLPRIAFTGKESSTGRRLWVGLYVSALGWQPGNVPFHGYDTFGIVAEILPGGGYRRLGVIGSGSITFDRAEAHTGGGIKGHWQGRVATTR